MQRWHKVNDTPSQNCIGSRVRIPQFDSAQKTQTGVVTGSKPTLAFTCCPPVPKADASPGMQFCDGVSFTLCHRCISRDMQRWHKVNDTPSQNCIPGDASALGTGGQQVNAKVGFEPVTTPVWVFCAESNCGIRTRDPMQFCDGVSFTLCHRCISGYATVA